MSKNVSSAARVSAFGGSDYGLYAINGGRKYLNAAERWRVLATVAELDASRALFILMLAWTGARLSEVLALTPSSFQVERGVVSFTTLKRRRHCVREVPLPAGLMERLNAEFSLLDAARDLERASARLWPWSKVTAWRYVKDVMKRAGVSGTPACPRGFRHGFGVGALQAGVPITLVQRWLGHARLSTTAIYADACGPEEQAMASRFWSGHI